MRQITLEQRYEIASLLKVSANKQEIADRIGCHKTTIYREINRNKDMCNSSYNASLANRKCNLRHNIKKKKIWLTDSILKTIEHYLRKDYSPKQIVGICKKKGIACVSYETIYKYIWPCKKSKEPDLYKHLRRRGRKYQKRSGVHSGRGMIKNRVGIEKRPKIVEFKFSFGDLEVDTIIGKDHIGAIVTINDRASGMVKMKKTKNREVCAAIIELLEDWLPYIKTMTADNGKQFGEFEQIVETSQIDFYFADPYRSWQRGANENLNGLIRQYYPTKTDFS